MTPTRACVGYGGGPPPTSTGFPYIDATAYEATSNLPAMNGPMVVKVEVERGALERQRQSSGRS